MKRYLLWVMVLFCGVTCFAHPMPSSVVELSVLDRTISGEAKIPLLELGNAVGDQRILHISDPFFQRYFLDHIRAESKGTIWHTQINEIKVVASHDAMIGAYQEVVVQFTLTPEDVLSLRHFSFRYDAVIHQVVTHSALVYVRQDWRNGIQDENSSQQIGLVSMDVPTGKIFPLQVNLEQGSWWKGFSSMLHLGMEHINEGTDHLLFIIVLLLPAMLMVDGKRWGRFGGLRYSVHHLLKIVTAFTIGHSITLLAGALGWVRLPSQPVEIMIAVSILVSAIHALKPVFPGKEVFIASGFGLIHGLAFASVLANLQLSAGKLALSILGFNMGIEIMQLLVIASVVPWLILFSKTNIYPWVRTIGAILSGTAAFSWIMERISGKENLLTGFLNMAAQYGWWMTAGLAACSIITYFSVTEVKRIKAVVE